ncbi:mannitol-1-phosphate 5-dehydrogenase [Opitutus sp. ER46]|uniref:mannitol-1-phosphate 5-dehydrogenase n=1 Tax=Opitutus sp. ER46 TaxID=2161864 RepID=UPI0031B87EB3
MVTAQLVTTAVGLAVLPRIAPVIARGIARRRAQGVKEPLNVIACENGVRASTFLKQEVLKHLSPEDAAYAEIYVGFPDCSVDRIVPPVKSANPTDVVVEDFFEWNVEAGSFRGDAPQITGMNLADNLIVFVERKLFTLNTGHAVAAYLGWLRHHRTVDQSIADAPIRAIVRAAMVESGRGLIAEHGLDPAAHERYIDKILARLANPALEDELPRVCRDPLRKLGAMDRLVRPLVVCHAHGFKVENLLWGIGAALRYANAGDPQSVRLQDLIQTKGLRAAAAEITGITAPELLAGIATAYANVEARLNEPGI